MSVPESQISKPQQKFENAVKVAEKKGDKSSAQKAKILKRKLVSAKSITSLSTPSSSSATTRKLPATRSPSSTYIKRKRIKSRRQLVLENKKLKEQNTLLTEKINKLHAENLALKAKNKYSQQNILSKTKANNNLHEMLSFELSKYVFSYENLLSDPNFKHLCGLTDKQFDILYDLVKPYCSVIEYPSYKGSGMHCLDKATELYSVLNLCRHSCDYQFMAYILKVSSSTIHRIFVGWILFLDTLLNQLSLKPTKGFLIQKMPEAFIKTGHGLTDVVIDCTEFRFQKASNFDLNTLMFSNYKNHVTGKALIGIAPHGGGLYFSDVYPGSISDSAITEKSRVLDFVEPEHEIMSDKGFAIQDYCSCKGIYLNRPAQKNNPQFSNAEIAGNFDIAATRIHVKRFIDRVREWNTVESL